MAAPFSGMGKAARADVDEDTGTTVNLGYDVPFKFTGKLDKVTIDVGPMEGSGCVGERPRPT